MALKEGDKVRIVTRDVTADDKKNSVYYSHMAGLTGKVENIFSPTEIAVNIDRDALKDEARKVHFEAEKRMWSKFWNDQSEASKAMFEDDEKIFKANYVLLVREQDLEKV